MKYAVAYINFFDNDLQIKIVDGSDWKNALDKAFPELVGNLSSDVIGEAKEEAFNQDWLFEVTEIR